MLTTIGARSGKARTVPLVAIEDGERIVLIASSFGRAHHPGWYHNLRAHPQAGLAVRGQSRDYIAREATGEEREAYWRRAVALYAGFNAYQQRTGGRKIPVMVLETRTRES